MEKPHQKMRQAQAVSGEPPRTSLGAQKKGCALPKLLCTCSLPRPRPFIQQIFIVYVKSNSKSGKGHLDLCLSLIPAVVTNILTKQLKWERGLFAL